MNFTPTDLRISTHTAICNINSPVNLYVISKYLEIDDQIKYVEFGDKVKKGVNTKVKSKKGQAKKKVFFNQITMLISPKEGVLNNVKLFNNGAISMTGLKELDEGKISVNILLDKIKKIEGVCYYDFKTDDSVSNILCKFCNKNVSENNIEVTHCGHNICKLCSKTAINECKECGVSLKEKAIMYPNIASIKGYNIVLINSDYYLGIEIKRNELHNILVNRYNILSSFEPCIYPGINSKYYWNKEYQNKEFEGKCYCDVYCNGKGDGDGNGNCKKITIAIFQSGSIIITGARSLEQIEKAHSFINRVINDNISKVKNDNSKLLGIDGSIIERKKIIKLKIKSIRNYPEELKNPNMCIPVNK